MVKQVRFHRLGGPEVLQVDEIDLLPPGPGELRIKVEALGLNRAEALFRSGSYIEEPKLPSAIGLEAAGLVLEVGHGVKSHRPGDRVAVIPPLSMNDRPVHATEVNFPADLVVETPSIQSSIDAAATWMAFLTAYGALVEVGRVREGDMVIITAASSSVGLAALQLANWIGATPIAVTRTTSKREALLAAGASHVIVSGDGDVAAQLMAITGPEGARIVFDAVGGGLLGDLLSIVSNSGIAINYGALDPAVTAIEAGSLLGRSLTLRGYLVHEITRDPVCLERAKAFILNGVMSGRLRPIIARTFPIERIDEAHGYLESNDQFGKIVVTC